MGQSVFKPKPPSPGFPRAQTASPEEKRNTAANPSVERAEQLSKEAERRAQFKREWDEATKISEQRHALLARLQKGEVSRESIDPAELLVLDELARVQRQQTGAKRGRTVFKLGQGVMWSGLLAGLASIPGISTVSNACMRIAAQPSALTKALGIGAVGLIVAGLLLMIWGANRWFL